MGVPGLFRWFLQQYPQGCQELLAWRPLSRPQSLYIDLNSTLHRASRESNGDIKAIATAIDEIVQVVRPQQLLFLALDGVPPRIKEEVQRQRRAKIIHNKDQPKFNPCNITPGTKWMRNVEAYLCGFIEKKRRGDDVYWANLKQVVFSGTRDPGEGEQKIMDHLRAYQSVRTTSAGQHIVWSNDADTVLLSMAQRVSKITVISQRCYSDGVTKYTRFDIDVLRDAIIKEYAREYQGDLPWIVVDEIDKVIPPDGLCKVEEKKPAAVIDGNMAIGDLVFMTLFAGNDFLPPIPSAHSLQGSLRVIHDIWVLYEQLPPDCRQLHDGRGRINLQSLCKLLEVISDQEKLLYELQCNESSRSKRNTSSDDKKLANIARRRDEWEALRLGMNGQVDGKQLPYVWCGPVSALAGINGCYCNVKSLPGSAPITLDMVPRFAGLGKGSILTLDGQPLISPMMMGILNLMYELKCARSSTAMDAGMLPRFLEVHGEIDQKRLKWLQLMAQYMSIQFGLYTSPDPEYQKLYQSWRLSVSRHHKKPLHSTKHSAAIVKLSDSLPPSYIISLKPMGKSSSSNSLAKDQEALNMCSNIALVNEADWDTLYFDARMGQKQTDDYAEWKSGFYRRHYPTTYNHNRRTFVRDLCQHYIYALAWTSRYYFGGQVMSWDFCWSADIGARLGDMVAPLASDILACLRSMTDSDAKWLEVPYSNELPPTAREHMLSVMPRHSWPQSMNQQEQELADLLHSEGFTEAARKKVRLGLSRWDDPKDISVVNIWMLH